MFEVCHVSMSVSFTRRMITERSEEAMSTSARNHLKGKITDIRLGDIMAQVTVKVGQNLIESVITRQSAEELGLKKGDEVTAVVKATEVMISK